MNDAEEDRPVNARYTHHKYTYQPNGGYPKHEWSLIGQKGGLQFHCAIVDGCRPSAILEIHKREGHGAPHYVRWLLEGPCWHDGTSLYATETLWPMIEPLLKAGEHNKIFKLLEGEADKRFGQ